MKLDPVLRPHNDSFPIMTEELETTPKGDNAVTPRKNIVWNVVMLFFSVYAIIAVSIVFLIPISSDIESILLTLDHVVCGVFFVDFLMRLATAESKGRYLRWGWLDLLSCIPAIEPLRVARLARVFRLIRILRGVRSARTLILNFFHNKSSSAFALVSAFSFLTVLFGAILVLEVENSAGGNIRSGDDALWWAFVTVTTCGYGDFYPVTGAGRLIASVLMVCGIGVFGTFTAYIASMFVEQTEEVDAARDAEVMDAINELKSEVASLRAEMHSGDEERR